METLKVMFAELGFDLTGIDNQILVDPTGPVPADCVGGSCDNGCSNSCSTCKHDCSAGGK